MLNSEFSRTRYVSRKREILKYLFMPVRDGLWSFYRRPHANKVAAARNKNNPRSYSFFSFLLRGIPKTILPREEPRQRQECLNYWSTVSAEGDWVKYSMKWKYIRLLIFRHRKKIIITFPLGIGRIPLLLVNSAASLDWNSITEWLWKEWVMRYNGTRSLNYF